MQQTNHERQLAEALEALLDAPELNVEELEAYTQQVIAEAREILERSPRSDA